MESIAFGDTNYGTQIGKNYGTANFYPPPRPETPPAPLSTVPFRRDPDFVECGTLLDQLQEKGSTQGNRIVLVGLGGVGKSQLAIEYCYRVRDRYPATWVLWIHASNTARFEQSCWDIADRVKIPGRQDPKANIFKLLQDWLNNPKTGEWVLVLDNLDNDEFLHTTPVQSDNLRDGQNGITGRSIWSYIGQSSIGVIVTTSRSRQVALRMVEDNDIISVEPMDKAHAISLFEKRIGTQSDRAAMIELVTVVDFMPLAIVQAASFIRQRRPRESVPRYLERFRESDRQKITLLDYEGGKLRRDRDAKNSILITWQISFDDIQERRPSAANLLSFMSFFDRQGIPDTLLREDKAITPKIKNSPLDNTDDRSHTLTIEDNTSETSEADAFENDVLMLKDYSLISISSSPANFGMHRLVQLATQEWLQAQNQHENWKERYIRKLYSVFPIGEFENWKECQVLFAHVQSAVTQKPQRRVSLEEWAALLHNAALFAQTRGNLIDSEEMAQRAVDAMKWLFGTEHPSTLASMNNLASTYQNQGGWKKAEELNVRVMETCKQVLGPEHPDTLTCMNNLALTFWNQGRWKEAEELNVRVMETCKQVLGPEHPDTLASMGNLAFTLKSLGRDEAALQMMVECATFRNQQLGPNHPLTLSSMSILDEWRGIDETTSSNPLGSDNGTQEQNIRAMSTQALPLASERGRHSKRAILARIFFRKK